MFGKDHPHVAGIRNNIGNVHRKRDERDLAIENYESALEIYERRGFTKDKNGMMSNPDVEGVESNLNPSLTLT